MTGGIKHIVVALFLALFVGGLWFALTTTGYFSTLRIDTNEVTAQTVELENNILRELARVESITLNEGVFGSQTYKSLVDLGVDLGRPTLSRPNPFDSL